jgi:hypothetical protein
MFNFFFANFSAIIYACFISRTTFVVPLTLLSFFIALIANEMIKSCRFFGSFSHSARRVTSFRSQLRTLLALNYCVCLCYYNFSFISSPDSIFRVTELTLRKLSPCSTFLRNFGKILLSFRLQEPVRLSFEHQP